MPVGKMYFATDHLTNGAPRWWNGTNWVDSVGNTTFQSTSLTPGSVPFAGPGGQISQLNAYLFWDNANFRLGVGTATPSYPLDLAMVNNGLLAYGFYSHGNCVRNPTGSDSQYISGIYVEPLYSGTANTTGLLIHIGSIIRPDFSGTITAASAASRMAGLESTPVFRGVGTMPYLYGARIQAEINNPSATVTNSYGMRIAEPAISAGSITNNYALVIDNQTVGGTVNYAIKTGTGLHSFGDDVNLVSGKVYKVNGTQVVGGQVVNSDLAQTANSGDANTDKLIEALKAVVTTHGLGSAT
jgi:hypothetical protein